MLPVQVARSALAPNGKIVWVSTTQHGTGCDAASAATCNRWGNFSQCIEDYNNAAAVLWASRPDVITADLHGLVTAIHHTSATSPQLCACSCP